MTQRATSDRLDSWKEIAAYLRRDITTVQRWEKREAMPVHRHQHDKAGSVYAFQSELDAWTRSRRMHSTNRSSVSRRWLAVGMSCVSGVAAVALALLVGLFNGADRSIDRVDPQARLATDMSPEPAARQEYQVGRYFLWRFDEEDLRLAIGHFERATEIDPDFAAAYASLSTAWWARNLFGDTELNTARSAAIETAQKAVKLDDRLAAAWVARGDVLRVFDGNPSGAEAMFTRALTLDPGSVDAHHSYALLLMGLGRFDQALDHIARAAAADPLAPAIESNFGRILYRAGRFEDAIPHIERALELEPGMVRHYSRLGDVYNQLGKYDRALAAYDMARLQAPARDGVIAATLARMGNRDDAKRLLERLGRQPDRMPLWQGAAAYTALGDMDRASGLLRTMIEREGPGLRYFMVDPQFAELRAAPQWRELLRHVNGPPGAMR